MLNNFVSELANAASPRESYTLAFTNPEAGWVFFRVCARAGATNSPVLRIDSAANPLALREYPVTGDLEAFQRLPAGAHTLGIENAKLRRIIVRSVPELGLYAYPPTPMLAGYTPSERGAYSQAYLDRHVLPHLTTLFAADRKACGDVLDTWKREGRLCIGSSHMIDLGRDQPSPAVETYQYWAKSPGASDPEFDGVIVDEFANVMRNHYGEWLGALRLLDADPGFAGKTFYAYCGEMYRFPYIDATQRYLLKKNHILAYEQYLSNTVSLDQERCYIARRYTNELREWKERFPDALKRMMVCLVSGNIPASFDTDPRVDFNVGLDMQMRCMATEPELEDIHGVMQWSTYYTDEDTLRLLMLMYRHYCIEGKTSSMLNDPFELRHVRNPDFEFGLEGWDVAPAEAGAITQGYIDGFSLLSQRYWPTYKGDTFVSMKRSARGPNRIRQTIRHLTPGRLYTLKLIAADLKHLDRKEEPGMRVDLEGVEVAPDLSFHAVFNGGAKVSGFASTNGTLHRIVFRAKSSTATLSIVDWQSDERPGGYPDQELVCNYVLVRPYYPAK